MTLEFGLPQNSAPYFQRSKNIINYGLTWPSFSNFYTANSARIFWPWKIASPLSFIDFKYTDDFWGRPILKSFTEAKKTETDLWKAFLVDGV